SRPCRAPRPPRILCRGQARRLVAVVEGSPTSTEPQPAAQRLASPSPPATVWLPTPRRTWRFCQAAVRSSVEATDLQPALVEPGPPLPPRPPRAQSPDKAACNPTPPATARPA